MSSNIEASRKAAQEIKVDFYYMRKLRDRYRTRQVVLVKKVWEVEYVAGRIGEWGVEFLDVYTNEQAYMFADDFLRTYKIVPPAEKLAKIYAGQKTRAIQSNNALVDQFEHANRRAKMLGRDYPDAMAYWEKLRRRRNMLDKIIGEEKFLLAISKMQPDAGSKAP